MLTGGSAGADFTAIYALAAAEPEYAKKLGIEPVMTMDENKCVVINEACTLAKSIASDDNMLAMLQNWMGVENYEENELVKLAEVSSQIKSVYPPAYLIMDCPLSFSVTGMIISDLLDEKEREKAYLQRNS